MDQAITDLDLASYRYTEAMRVIHQVQQDLADLEPGKLTAGARKGLEQKGYAAYRATIPPLSSVVAAAPPAAKAADSSYPSSWQDDQVTAYLKSNGFTDRQAAWVLAHAHQRGYHQPGALTTHSAIFEGVQEADIQLWSSRSPRQYGTLSQKTDPVCHFRSHLHNPRTSAGASADDFEE
ncbi:hypothetical protein [Specibacter cremeus]|uniref:hypothetical protein n=1 Tax=Specibacter cremeus TaxID=1629051 RepID=UPI000F7A4480|nr:hypothetical protein [Specibacter cremeus]